MGSVRHSALRWTVLFALVMTTGMFLIVFASVPGADGNVRPALAQGEQSSTPTPVRFSLTRTATDEATSDIPDFFLTLTAMEPTYSSQPTATPGISKLAKTGKPHFVDFNAYWCVPCNEMRPFLADLEKKYEDQITFDDVNVDSPESQGLANKYKVQYIPLMVLLDSNLKIVARLEGYQDANQVETALKDLLKASDSPTATATGQPGA